jgi:large subunit ribosomal protein L9
MQIILLDKIANVGNLGDVVKVKDGYARNFLIPQGKAKRATPANLAAIEARRAELEAAAGERLANAQGTAEKLEGSMLRIAQKAGVDGRLFGSVTNVDIVQALKAQGVEIEKAMVRMPSGPLKQVGEHPVTVALHTDVTAHITVNVVGETVGN